MHQMTAEIAFPSKYPNLSSAVDLEDRYGSIEISDVGYFENVISFAQSKNHERFAKLAESSDVREWDRTVETVNVSRRELLVQPSPWI